MLALLAYIAVVGAVYGLLIAIVLAMSARARREAGRRPVRP